MRKVSILLGGSKSCLGKLPHFSIEYCFLGSEGQFLEQLSPASSLAQTSRDEVLRVPSLGLESQEHCGLPCEMRIKLEPVDEQGDIQWGRVPDQQGNIHWESVPVKSETGYLQVQNMKREETDLVIEADNLLTNSNVVFEGFHPPFSASEIPFLRVQAVSTFPIKNVNLTPFTRKRSTPQDAILSMPVTEGAKESNPVPMSKRRRNIDSATTCTASPNATQYRSNPNDASCSLPITEVEQESTPVQIPKKRRKPESTPRVQRPRVAQAPRLVTPPRFKNTRNELLAQVLF